MNRIYRRIWNHAKGCWDVASELAKPCGKRSSGTQGICSLPVLLLASLGADAAAKERRIPGCDPFNVGNGTIINCIPMSGHFDDTKFSPTALAGGWNTLTFGAGSVVNGDNTAAFGVGARINGQNSAAFGFKASTYAVDSVAVGYNARTSADGGHNVAIGANAYAAYIGATALGNKAEARAQNAIALGSGSSSRGVDALALGANSSTSAAGSMAVGAKASASRTNAIALGLSSVAQQEDAVALGASTIANGAGGVALGAKAMVDTGAGTGGGAIGGGARAGSWGYTGAIAIGGDTRAYIDGVALGYAASASAQGAVALGVRSVATEANTVSVGSASVRRRIVNVADGRVTASSTDAVTGKQLHAMNERVDGMIKQDSAGGVVRIANSNTGTEVSMRNAVLATRKVSGVSDGALTTTSTDAVNGRQLNTTNGNVTKAQTAADAAKADASKALAQVTTVTGLIGQASSTSSVRLGEKNSGTSLDVRNSANANRKVTGVADATLSTSSAEAVTGRQLNTTNENVAKAQTAAGEAKSDASKALTQVVTLGGLVGQVSATGNVRLGEKNSGTVLDVRNSANANRKLIGVADGVVSASSYEAVNGRQLNATNDKVATVEGVAKSAGEDAAAAKKDATKALAETAVLGGLVAQVSASGDVRLGEKNSGTTLDVRNSADANRKISGVADGSIDASSTEAVSGRQLYGTNSRVSALESANQYVSVGVDSFSQRAEAGLLGVAIGDSARAGTEGGTALGALSVADGINSVAIGRGSTVSKDSLNGFALGAGAQVEAAHSIAVGAGAKVRVGATGALAIGSGAEATESDTVSFGTKDSGRRLVNVARGTADHDVTTVSQLKDSFATLGGGAGMDASGNIIAPTYMVQGGTQNTVEDALMALDGAVITAGRRADKVEGQLSSIFQDSPSTRADGVNQLTLAGTHGMVISNVANGLIAAGSRDAVNGGQLHSMQQQLNGRMDGLEQRIDAPQPQAMAVASVPEPEAPVPQAEGGQQVASVGEGEKPAPQPKTKNTPKPQVDTAELEKMLARANEYTDGAISNFERRLDKMDKRFNRMAAMSSAQTAMAMNTAGLATYNRLGAGVGYSEGESAMAVGYQRVLNEKGSATFSLNGAFTNSGERSMGVGVGIGW